MTIRKATIDDLDKLAKLVSDVCIHENIWTDYTEKDLLEDFKIMFNYSIEKQDWIQPECFIYEYKNEIIGMINFRQTYASYNLFEIGWCMIKPKFQKSFIGVGYKLCIHTINHIKSIRKTGIIQCASRIPEPLIKYGFIDNNIIFNNDEVESKLLYYKW